MKPLACLLLLIGFAAADGLAETLTLEQVWRASAPYSLNQQALALEHQAADRGARRLARHWYPRLAIQERATLSNDPSFAFFSLLQQRAVDPNDFLSDPLNHPDTRLINRLGLGLDWPLFEGGGPTAMRAMQRTKEQTRGWLTSQGVWEEYAKLAGCFGVIGVIERAQASLDRQEGMLEGFIKRYHLKSRTNPLGYSGWIGLQSIKHQIAVIRDQWTLLKKTSYLEIKTLGHQRNDAWNPEFSSSEAFVDKFLMVTNMEPSHAQRAATNEALIYEQQKLADQSRLLPRLTLFGEGYLWSGSRTTDSGFSGGLLLDWPLVDRINRGKSQEAGLQAQAAKMRSTHRLQAELLNRESLNLRVATLNENFKTLRETQNLLEEQTMVAISLFQNGVINALQLTEVLSRRMQNLKSLTETEIAYIQTSAQRLPLYPPQIPFSLEQRS